MNKLLVAAVIYLATVVSCLAQSWVPASNVGGTSNAVTLSGLAIGTLSDILGVPIRFLPLSSSVAGTTTVNPSGPGGALGPVAVYRSSGGGLVPIAGGDFSTGVVAEIIYDGTEFVQQNPATGSAPVGTEISYTGATVPPGYLVENGVCVSQTTYSALYASYGNTDVYSPGSTGSSCSAGQFHVKFANGRASVAADTQGSVTAGVLTSGGSGCAATTFAVNCGAQNRTVAQANLPNVNFTVTNPTFTWGTLGVSGAGSPVVVSIASTGLSNTITTTGGVVNSGGSGTALPTVQPTSTVFMAVKY